MTEIRAKLLQPKIFLLLILLIAFWVRLYKLDNPIADWHSWRQADTAAVARNFYKEGFNPLYPKDDDMSAVSDTGKLNSTRLRFVEFPIYPSLVYFGYLLNGGVDEKIARLVSVIFSLGSITFIYLLTKKYLGILTALLAAFFYATLPYSIFYSRVILPEPSLIFFSLGMLYFLDRFIWEKRIGLLSWSIFFIACAFLTKPTAIFYLLPLFYSYYLKEKKIFPIPKKYLLLILGILPFLAWRFWIGHYPDSIPSAGWLLNGNGIRGKPVFWQWILDDRFRRELLGVTGTAVFFLGLLAKPRLNEGYFLHLLALGSFLYLIVFATGNVQHDYYQTLIVPALVIFVARGFVLLLKSDTHLLSKLFTIPLAGLFFVMLYYSTWNEIKGLYQINNPVIIEAGKRADKILPSNAIVLAPYNGDTAFLYQTNRIGFPVNPSSLEDLRDQHGVNYLVSVNFDKDTNYAMKNFTIVEKTEKYVIVDLTKPSQDNLKK